MVRFAPWCLLLCAGPLVACGDDAAPPPITFDAGPRVDAGPRPDGGSQDAAPPLDAALDAGPGLVCRFAGPDDVLKLGVDTRPTERTVSVAPAAAGFGVVWASAPLGIEDVHGAVVPFSGPAGDVVAITSDASRQGSPFILNAGTAFEVVWYDNSTAGYEIYARRLDAALAPMGAAERLTDNAFRDDQPAVHRLGDGFLAAWVQDDMLTGERVAHTRLLSPAGAPEGAARAVTTPPASPTSPVLASISGGVALAWAERNLTGADATLLKLDMTGAAVGPVVVLSTENNVAGSLDLALSEGGGGAVFDVLVAGSRDEVRFRSLDGSGDPIGVEQIVTLAPERGRGASIAYLGGGFVVAYRALADEGLAEPTLRVALLSAHGEILETMDLVPVEETGGRVTVRVSPDGRTILIAWCDAGAMGTDINVARIRCE